MFGNLFGSKPAAAPAPAPAAGDANANANANAEATNNANANANADANANVEKSPLDKFADLWQPNKTDEQQNQPLFAVDQSKLMEAAGKLDFTKLVKPEQLQAIARGGEEAAAAFLQAINTVGQAGFANALAANTKLIEQALERKEAEFEARLPGAIKSYNIETSLAQDPVLKHPAAKPVVGAIARAMASKNPDATPEELQKAALELLRDIAGGKVDKNATEVKKEKAGDFDWDAWINS